VGFIVGFLVGAFVALTVYATNKKPNIAEMRIIIFIYQIKDLSVGI